MLALQEVTVLLLSIPASCKGLSNATVCTSWLHRRDIDAQSRVRLTAQFIAIPTLHTALCAQELVGKIGSTMCSCECRLVCNVGIARNCAMSFTLIDNLVPSSVEQVRKMIGHTQKLR